MDGKFLYAGDEKLFVRGVTYGTFRPGAWDDYPEPELVDRELAQMAENGINAIRTYTAPPGWLLDQAFEHGIGVMVGLPWEQHVAFLDDRDLAQSIEERIRAGVRACAGHPAVLCYAVGNEIPAPIVRWHGARRTERFIERLYRAAKDEDPAALVTYVNYPSTEYLQLPFLDLLCFNVYLEAEELLEAYLARLQNVAGDRPLLLTELGLDSVRHGEEAQAISLGWQIRTAFGSGCAGAFVFSWTDEWHRGGYDVEDWRFGLVDYARRPKPALASVREAFAEVPFRDDLSWPRISVVVCSYNGARTIADCLEGIAKIDYPDFECIVVDDGSTDGTAAIAQEFDVRVIRTGNEGLASARNTGMQAATGEILAYVDDDARPDRHWLVYLAASFLKSPSAAVGGPNIAPAGDGSVAECVTHAPGGPVHVLVSDREAEHIPGCNMAVRKDCLEAIGGFDPQFRVAGDDVDICWRLRDQGWTIGFNPAAMVWHHRRNTVRAYLRQQHGYGKAEALLERKWPQKYNRGGHPSWSGRVYGNGGNGRRWRIYYGTWGSAMFQSIYERSPGTLASLPLMPEWYLLIALLTATAVYGLVWEPLFFQIPLLGDPITLIALCLAVAAPIVRALATASSSVRHLPGTRRSKLGPLALTASLHLLQPVARLVGRMRQGLTPWRIRARIGFGLPRARTGTVWSEDWRSLPDRLQRLEAELVPASTGVVRGGSFDRWDLRVRAGALGSARLRLTAEEHGDGRQLLRYRVWPTWSRGGTVLVLVLAALSGFAVHRGAVGAPFILGGLAGFIALRMLRECGGAVSLLVGAVRRAQEPALDDFAAALQRQLEAGERQGVPAQTTPVGARGLSPIPEGEE